MMSSEGKKAIVAVAFLASDANRFSINALTGAIEQDPGLHVKLAFPHPRSSTACQAEIASLIKEVGPDGMVVQNLVKHCHKLKKYTLTSLLGFQEKRTRMRN